MKTESKKEVKKELDTSIIEPGEYFSYLGKRYVKKHVFLKKYDEKGKPVLRKTWNLDGSIRVDGHMTCTHPVSEFWGIVEKKADYVKRQKKYLATNISTYGPIAPADLFKYENEPIVYDNEKLRDTILVRKGDKIVVQKEGDPTLPPVS